MRGQELCDLLRDQLGANNDRALAVSLGVAPSYISQVRSSDAELTPRKIAKFLARAMDHTVGRLFEEAIHPVVEFFEINQCVSKRGAKWIPFAADEHIVLYKNLKGSKGIYAFYNSEGEIIYVGRTKRRNLFDEMVDAYNRGFSDYNVYKVKHAWGRYEPNTSGKIRQIGWKKVSIADTAHYFSCYQVTEDLVIPLEAFLIRVLPNDVINVRMERPGKPARGA